MKNYKDAKVFDFKRRKGIFVIYEFKPLYRKRKLPKNNVLCIFVATCFNVEINRSEYNRKSLIE